MNKLLTSLLATAVLTSGLAHADTTLLNVSYDVMRDFYKDYNPAFQKYWQGKAGEKVVIQQSHGGSSAQARSVIEGLQADVITMNQHSDIDAVAQRGKQLPENWASRLPDNAAHVNPNGGAIAIGHPLGASGARLVATALNQLELIQGRYALCSMCIGVGQGIALIIERV